MTRKEAVMELFHWQNSTGDNFHSMLYRLIEKADIGNRIRLRRGFPEEVQAYMNWQASATSKEFFDRELRHETEETNTHNSVDEFRKSD